MANKLETFLEKRYGRRDISIRFEKKRFNKLRQIVNVNQAWSFLKDAKDIPAALPSDWEVVNIPHSWNSVDGMDGGADYFRGTCHYAKVVKKSELPESECYFLEINGANSSADVYVNGETDSKSSVLIFSVMYS